MNRRRFLTGIAAALVATASMTRMGRTLADVMQKPGPLMSGEIGSYEGFEIYELGGRMYSEELSKHLRDAFVYGHGIGKTQLRSEVLTFSHIPSEDYLK